MIVVIFTSPESSGPMLSHQSIEAIAGKGLAGDRYATGKGYYSGVVQWDAHLTLIAQEPFDAMQANTGLQADPALLRRNIVTRGIHLATLIGKDFQIGETARFHGRKAWPPCSHIMRTSGRSEIFQFLGGHCGIGVSVLAGGTIKVGDEIQILPRTDKRPSGGIAKI